MSVETDFTILQGSDKPVAFNIENEDGSLPDLTGSTVVYHMYLLGSASPLYSITCDVNIPTARVSIPFTTTETANQGIFEYKLIETTSLAVTNTLLLGNTTISADPGFSQSIDSYIREQTPVGLTLTEDFKTQHIMYWQDFLHILVDPNIPEESMHTDEAWTHLQRVLIAKLVVYDAMVLAAKGSFVAFLSGSSGSLEEVGVGGIKKITTGPADVEFFDTASSISNLFKPGANGLSAFQGLQGDICTLAKRIRVYLDFCGQLNHSPIVPTVHRRS